MFTQELGRGMVWASKGHATSLGSVQNGRLPYPSDETGERGCVSGEGVPCVSLCVSLSSPKRARKGAGEEAEGAEKRIPMGFLY